MTFGFVKNEGIPTAESFERLYMYNEFHNYSVRTITINKYDFWVVHTNVQ